MNDKKVDIRIPSKLYEDLKQDADNKNISFASLVRLVLTEYLNETKQK